MAPTQMIRRETLNHPTHWLSTLTRRPLLWLAAPIFLSLQACANSAEPMPGPATPLWGTQWVLASVGAQPVIQGSQATLLFPEAGHLAGNGSCNRFSGAVQVQNGQMAVGALVSTKMACMGGAMAQESAYMAALQKAQRYERSGDTLLIHVQGMEQPLRFTAAK
jgi:heat shock protein HslJ